jgi:hypothetical protein
LCACVTVMSGLQVCLLMQLLKFALGRKALAPVMMMMVVKARPSSTSRSENNAKIRCQPQAASHRHALLQRGQEAAEHCSRSCASAAAQTLALAACWSRSCPSAAAARRVLLRQSRPRHLTRHAWRVPSSRHSLPLPLPLLQQRQRVRERVRGCCSSTAAAAAGPKLMPSWCGSTALSPHPLQRVSSCETCQCRPIFHQ